MISVALGDVLACGGASVSKDAGVDVELGLECNQLQPTVLPLDMTLTTAPPPTPQGGVISDGTYDLTSLTGYNSTTNGTKVMNTRTSLSISGHDLEAVSANPDVLHTSDTLTVTGTSYSLSESCPYTITGAGAGSYTATPTQIRLYTKGDSPIVTEGVYSRR